MRRLTSWVSAIAVAGGLVFWHWYLEQPYWRVRTVQLERLSETEVLYTATFHKLRGVFKRIEVIPIDLVTRTPIRYRSLSEEEAASRGVIWYEDRTAGRQTLRFIIQDYPDDLYDEVEIRTRHQLRARIGANRPPKVKDKVFAKLPGTVPYKDHTHE